MASVVITPTRPRAPELTEREVEVRVGRVRSSLSALSSRVYLPACAVAASAVLLVIVGWALKWGHTDFAGSVTDLRAVVAGPLTLAIIGIIAVVERVRPAQPRPLVARGHRHDLLFALLSATIVVPLVTALTLSFVAVVRTAAPWIVLPRMGVVPRWAAIVAIVVAMDACNWAAHLLNHRVRMFWRFHELHHSEEDMNVLTVFRTHPLIHVSYLVALIPGTVLLANGVMSITLLALYGAILAFAHSNTRMGFGPLERIFVSPDFHRVHHLVDGPQDVNLGFALTIWDQLFRCAVFPTEDTIRADTGLAGRPLVVENEGPRARHLAVFAAQLIAPFRPMHVATDLPPVRTRANDDTDEQREVAAW
jgi:sterol desaturase/sphingolipid hydroxylase (fatty acid hydroxylase superfamily)